MVPDGVPHGHCDRHHRVDRQVTKLDYALWVSLGAMAALKFDASGTRRGIADCPRDVWWFHRWSRDHHAGRRPCRHLLGVVADCRVPRRVHTRQDVLAVGQGAFTVFPITMIAISHPGSYSAGEMRVIDVALGSA